MSKPKSVDAPVSRGAAKAESVRAEDAQPSSDGATKCEAAVSTEAAPSRDMALIHGRTADGKGLQIIRRRDDALEFGCVRPIEEGKPLAGDVVKLKPRSDFPLLCDVETQFRLPASGGSECDSDEPARGAKPGRARKGPPRVTTDAYRQNWDAIYSRGRKATELN